MNELSKYLIDLECQLSDLTRHQLYVVDFTEVDMRAEGDCDGFHIPNSYHWSRPVFADRDKGPGCVLMLNSHQMIRDWGGCLEYARSRINAVGIHEAVHAVEHGFRVAPANPVESHDAFVGLVIKDLVNNPPKDEIAEIGAHTNNTHHGRTFVRIALHARHRMIDRGHSVPLGHLLDWEWYCPEPGYWYQHALRHEVESLSDIPLDKITEFPEPSAFAALWQDKSPALLAADRYVARQKEGQRQ